MTGRVRNPGRPSAVVAAIERAATRLIDLGYRLHAAAHARLAPARPQPAAPVAGAPVIPTVRYRDVPAAITWLCRAFGMKVHRVVTDASGAARYAELTIGSGMLMVAPIEDTAFGKLMVQPDEIGGVETQVCYLCVTNARKHYAHAKAAGAVIVLDPDHEANGGRGYSCRDPEGHVWNFGTYDPWEKAEPRAAATRRPAWSGAGGWRRAQQGLAALVLLALATALVPGLMPQPSARAGIAVAELDARAPTAVDERPPEPVAATPAAAELQERPQEAATPAAKTAAVYEPAPHSATAEAVAAAQRTAAEARAQLAEIRKALELAQRDASNARAQLDEMQRARQTAERAAADARERLASARKAAERARAEAATERVRRLAADRSRKRAASSSGRTRTRAWCYSFGGSVPPAGSAGRLEGFCKS